MVEFVRFPSVNNASDDGLLAMGGDLSLDTLVSAYAQGIFPWFNENQPILWWSPDPRMVLYPNDVKISRSLRKKLRRGAFRVSCNAAFHEVIQACALRGQKPSDATNTDTWISQAMADAYAALHHQQYAHSIEVWQDEQLVGGLYGVVLGKVFFGESMFSRASDASKIALVFLCKWLKNKNFRVIDCQVASDHLYSLGAIEIARTSFLEHLETADIAEPIPQFSQGFERFAQENVITIV